MNNRQKIFISAKELFHLNGIIDTSVDDILEKSNVSKSNFYYHFRSKIKLALIVLESEIKLFEEKIVNTSLRTTVLNPELRLQTFYKNLIEYHTKLEYKKGSIFGNIALEMSDKNELFRNTLSSFFLDQKFLIKECLEEGIQAEIFRSDLNTEKASKIILSHIEGSILITKTIKNISFLEEGGFHLIELIKKDS